MIGNADLLPTPAYVTGEEDVGSTKTWRGHHLAWAGFSLSSSTAQRVIYIASGGQVPADINALPREQRASTYSGQVPANINALPREQRASAYSGQAPANITRSRANSGQAPANINALPREQRASAYSGQAPADINALPREQRASAYSGQAPTAGKRPRT